MNKSPHGVEAFWLGRVPYQEAWELQGALVQEVKAGLRPDTVLFLEHPHVFTFGRRGRPEHLLWDEDERRLRGVEVVWSDRGGEGTYHGPGQLVGYPIFDLRRHGGDVLAYLRRLEGSLIHYLASLGLESKALSDLLAGVWSAGGPGAEAAGAPLAKVAAIGVKLTRHVVSHGFALNLTTDLGYFDGIVPCGLVGKHATSVAKLTGLAIETRQAAADYTRFLIEAFRAEVEWAQASRLPLKPSLEAGPRALPVI